MPKQAQLDGSLEDADDFTGFNELELLNQSLQKYSWRITDSQAGSAGYNFIIIQSGDKILSLHIYLRKITWRNRSTFEKGIQFAADHVTTGYEVQQSDTEKTVMFGIYKREVFNDYLICAWKPDEWGNRGRAFNCFIDVSTLAAAFVNGFSTDTSREPRKVFAFRPEFIHYYLLNKDVLHGINTVLPTVQPTYSNKPVNRILYGPPGTGKTYETIRLAVSIVKGTDFSEVTRSEIKREYELLVKSGHIHFVTFHQSYSYEEFVEGIKPKLSGTEIEYSIEDGIFKKVCALASLQTLTPKDNYVLIIDEINRGNISKIFGELITLIEPSKRVGAKEELKIKLSYSGANDKEPFGVPENLHIIGTMNSADRSIALIDTALRRRFSFLECPPLPQLLSNDLEGVNIQQLLISMNKRIEFLLDKDHLLGHAYFIDITSLKDLSTLFRNKILPLLEEYFYGDYEKIQYVLGDNYSHKKKDEYKIVIRKKTFNQVELFGQEVDGLEEKLLYELNEVLANEEYDKVQKEMFISIYNVKITDPINAQ